MEHFYIKIKDLPEEINGLVIVQLSDVHLSKNTAKIEKILNKVSAQNPDIIVITGDTVNKNTSFKICGLNELCQGLTKIAPAYAVSGNHETKSTHFNQWIKILERNNIIFIDNKQQRYTKNGKSLIIIGLADGDGYQTANFNNPMQMPVVLLAHRPELFVSSYSSASNRSKPDLVFSGHAHGGQFRLPLIKQGIFAPNQGLFPKYTSGLYFNNNVQMIVSRGLGKSIFPLRLNNRPHMPVIELVKAG